MTHNVSPWGEKRVERKLSHLLNAVESEKLFENVLPKPRTTTLHNVDNLNIKAISNANANANAILTMLATIHKNKIAIVKE